MAKSDITFDRRKLDRFARESKDAISDGLRNGIGKALDLWQVAAVNEAPIGRYRGRRGGNLRANIEKTPVTGNGLDLEGAVVANAFNDGFNYAFYLHEIGPGKGYEARTPGTTLEFLDSAADKQGERMQRVIETEIESEVKRSGLS